jgi:hypothetical protein
VSLQETKIAFDDFSAGITENFLPGKPGAYLKADNFLITRDAQLEERWGSDILGTNLVLPGVVGFRVSELIPFWNETELFTITNGSFYYNDGTDTWAELLGPGGGKAFTFDTTDSKVAYDVWRKHLFLTTDGGGGPQKVYRDDTGAIQLRQAGLPRPELNPFFNTDADLFNAAVLLAEEVKTALRAHFVESIFAVTLVNTHVTNQSTASLDALTSPSTYATLLAYVNTLAAAYDTHIADAQTGSTYHLGLYLPANQFGFLGRIPVLNISRDETLPTPTADNLKSIIRVLNDIRLKFNYHTYATITHQTARYLPSAVGYVGPSIHLGYGSGKITSDPIPLDDGIQFSTNYTPFIDYVNNLVAEFNAHLGGEDNSFGPGHNNSDSDNIIALPEATDLFGCVVLLNHLEFFYWWHYQDAGVTESGSIAITLVPFTGTFTATSATATSTTINGASFVGYTLARMSHSTSWDPISPYDFGPVKVTGGTATTVVFDVPADNSYAALPTAIVLANYHFDQDKSTDSKTTPYGYKNRLASLDYTLTDPTSILDVATVFVSLFKAHTLSGWKAFTNDAGTTYSNDVTLESASTLGGPHLSSLGIWPNNAITIAGVVDPTYYENPPALADYLYTYVWRYPYNVAGISFEDDSTPSQHMRLTAFQSIAESASSSDALYPYTLENLPVLANGLGQNWDTANIFLDIYRTVGNGTSFFKVGTVANGTTTFSDVTTDDSITAGEELYTNGGTLGNDLPPNAKYITILNSRAYYGYVTDVYSGEVFPNRIIESASDDPDSVPSANFDDLDDELTGLSSFRSYLIAFCRQSFYRIEGGFTETGEGALTHERISDTIGCVGHSSIVRTEVGIFFAGTNGIYWTDGYTFIRVTKELERTYNKYISTDLQKAKVKGTYDKLTRRVLFTFMSNPDFSDCDLVWVLDLNWGVSETMAFTTWSGGDNFKPSALVYYRGQIIRGDSRGYIFVHDIGFYSDPKVDTTVSPSAWIDVPIIYDFESCASNYGTTAAKKWVTRALVQAKNKSNLSLAIAVKNDDSRGGYKSLTPIRARPNLTWGTPGILWRNADCLWTYGGTIDDFRRMPAGHLRCMWQQVKFTNATVVIANSDTYGLANTGTVPATTGTATLTGSYKWPLNSVTNYVIAFEKNKLGAVDGYVTEYPIISRSDTVVTFTDTHGTSPVSLTGAKWIIRGIPVHERFQLISYVMTFAPLSNELGAYQGAQSSDGGENL